MLKVVEVARQAVASGDYAVLKGNLTALSDYLSTSGLSVDDRRIINQTIRNIEYMISKENARRSLISNESIKYDEASKKLKNCDELMAFYEMLLNDPFAQSYTYSSTPDPNNTTQLALNDLFESIKDVLGLPSVPATLADLRAEIAKIEKEMDESAFAINKANGVYDEKVSAKDLARARELAQEKKAIEEDRKKREALKKELKGKVSTSDFAKYTGTGKARAIEAKIAAIEAIPQKRRSKDDKDLLRILQGLKALATIKDMDDAKKTELSDIYTKYGVNPTAADAIDQLNDLLSTREVENTAENDVGLTPNDFSERINNSPVTASEGKRVISTLLSNDVGETLDEATTYLRQQGYAPCAGKESFIYARPVFKKAHFWSKPKVASMELVEESIESLLKNPEGIYASALKELQARANNFESGTKITNQDIAKMREAFQELIKAGRYDEAIKRIIATKSAITRTDLSNFAAQHSATKDGSGNPQSVTFPGGDDNYIDVPHIPTKKRFFGIITVPEKLDPDTPNDTIKTVRNEKYLRYQPANRGTGPVVSRNVVRDRTHHKDDRDER